jgi:hypothetical protein
MSTKWPVDSFKTKQHSVKIRHQEVTTQSVQTHAEIEVVRLMAVNKKCIDPTSTSPPLSKRHQDMYK